VFWCRTIVYGARTRVDVDEKWPHSASPSNDPHSLAGSAAGRRPRPLPSPVGNVALVPRRSRGFPSNSWSCAPACAAGRSAIPNISKRSGSVVLHAPLRQVIAKRTPRLRTLQPVRRGRESLDIRYDPQQESHDRSMAHGRMILVGLVGNNGRTGKQWRIPERARRGSRMSRKSKRALAGAIRAA
jgi:hypothetical protein